MFLLGTLMAIPNLGTGVKDGCGPAQIIEANFSPDFATIYLLVVSAAIFVCCLSIMAATIRLGFGMARDNQLPFSKPLSQGLARTAHPGVDLHHRRGPRRGPVPPVLRRWHHRDRGHRR